MAHQLVDHPGRDAVVLQPGREGVAEVMGAAQVQAEQIAVRPRLSDRTQVGVPEAVARCVRNSSDDRLASASSQLLDDQAGEGMLRMPAVLFGRGL
jgi:hypothetical protein